MDDLLVIKTSKCALKDFSPESSIRLWWEAKTRRPNQRKRKQYDAHKKSTVSASTTSSSSTVSLLDSESCLSTTSTRSDNNTDSVRDEEEEVEDNAILLNDWDRWLMNDEESGSVE